MINHPSTGLLDALSIYGMCIVHESIAPLAQGGACYQYEHPLSSCMQREMVQDKGPPCTWQEQPCMW
jgi:hypothetical protein